MTEDDRILLGLLCLFGVHSLVGPSQFWFRSFDTKKPKSTKALFRQRYYQYQYSKAIMFLWAQHKANSTIKGVQESLENLGSTKGDKDKIAREQERNEMSSELDKKKADRAERKAKLTEQWAANRAGPQ
jgi:hypothetical protein